jgi:hypothetical protein
LPERRLEMSEGKQIRLVQGYSPTYSDPRNHTVAVTVKGERYQRYEGTDKGGYIEWEGEDEILRIVFDRKVFRLGEVGLPQETRPYLGKKSGSREPKY